MNTKQLTAALALIAVGIAGTYGLDVNTGTPGSLKDVISNPSAVTNLAVKGPVDASDLYYIGSEMKSLTSLDLSAATIEEYNGVTLNGHKSYPAATIPAGAFSGLGLATVKFPAAGSIIIDEAAFMNTALTSVSLPANIDSVGTGAFAACTNLRTVTMPTARMGKSVFSDCTALTTVNMETVTVVPDATFRGCTALATVNGSENIVSIGQQAFEGDIALTDFVFGRSLRDLGVSSFAGTGLQNLFMGNADRLSAIGDQAFAGTDVDRVELPGNLTELGASAFFGDTKLTALELPASLITIGDHAFNGTHLTGLTLPGSLEEIGNYALADQTEIKEMVLPPTLIHIGDYAMEDMTGLVKIDATGMQTVPSLGENVWEGVDQPAVKLVLYKEYADAYKDAEQWKNFTFEILTGADDAVADAVVAPAVRGRFVGTDLHLESNGALIDTVRLFDTAGRMLLSVQPSAESAVIDTAHIQGAVFVVNITLDNGMNSSLKLGRR